MLRLEWILHDPRTVYAGIIVAFGLYLWFDWGRK